MNSRQFLNFFKSKTGTVLAFGLVIFIACSLLVGILYFRGGSTAQLTAVAAKAEEAFQPVKAIFPKGDASYANKSNESAVTGATNAVPPPPAVSLPISLFHRREIEPEVSDTYAPFGRLIPCETVITIDSAKIETPIIGYVTEDVWHDGKLIIPAGAEVHGKAQVDPSRERIASDNNWMLVWRTTDRLNGAELPLHGVALDMERNEQSGTWQLTDGSAGLKGDIIKSDKWVEIKLFASTFLSAATSGLQDTQSSSNALTGQTTQSPLATPKNAGLQGASAVLNNYAQQIADSIKRDGFYVRVPAGKQFYLYVTQTIDLENAKRGISQITTNNNSQPQK